MTPSKWGNINSNELIGDMAWAANDRPVEEFDLRRKPSITIAGMSAGVWQPAICTPPLSER
jgi:hypothetical protein